MTIHLLRVRLAIEQRERDASHPFYPYARASDAGTIEFRQRIVERVGHAPVVTI
jgi:hypothetical protein